MLESPRRAEAEFVPFDIGQGLPILSGEYAHHFAACLSVFARAQPVRDTVANLDFINGTIRIRHGASRLILKPYSAPARLFVSNQSTSLMMMLIAAKGNVARM